MVGRQVETGVGGGETRLDHPSLMHMLILKGGGISQRVFFALLRRGKSVSHNFADVVFRIISGDPSQDFLAVGIQ